MYILWTIPLVSRSFPHSRAAVSLFINGKEGEIKPHDSHTSSLLQNEMAFHSKLEPNSVSSLNLFTLFLRHTQKKTKQNGKPILISLKASLFSWVTSARRTARIQQEHSPFYIYSNFQSLISQCLLSISLYSKVKLEMCDFIGKNGITKSIGIFIEYEFISTFYYAINLFLFV